jgi:uncharacterized protein YxeA
MKKLIALMLALLAISVIVFAGDFKETQKLNFLARMQESTEKIVALRAEMEQLTSDYFSRGYNSGGANELVAADLVGTSWENLAIADITAIVTSDQSFETWIDAGHDDNYSKITK